LSYKKKSLCLTDSSHVRAVYYKHCGKPDGNCTPEQIRLLVVDDDREVGSAMLQVLAGRGIHARVVGIQIMFYRAGMISGSLKLDKEEGSVRVMCSFTNKK
jgi:hypothetical protein